jgi:hypothetical protein
MIQSEHDEEIKKFKAEHIRNIKDNLVENGGIAPHFTMFCFKTDPSLEGNDRYAIRVFEVPGIFLEEAGKEMLTKILIPLVIEKFEKEGNLIPICISWASEAWIRKGERGQEHMRDQLPKEEGIIATFETISTSNFFSVVFTREGKRVNSEGEMVDNIVFGDEKSSDDRDCSSVGGRFQNLFNRFHVQDKTN